MQPVGSLLRSTALGDTPGHSRTSSACHRPTRGLLLGACSRVASSYCCICCILLVRNVLKISPFGTSLPPLCGLCTCSKHGALFQSARLLAALWSTLSASTGPREPAGGLSAVEESDSRLLLPFSPFFPKPIQLCFLCTLSKSRNVA